MINTDMTDQRGKLLVPQAIIKKQIRNIEPEELKGLKNQLKDVTADLKRLDQALLHDVQGELPMDGVM